MNARTSPARLLLGLTCASLAGLAGCAAPCAPPVATRGEDVATRAAPAPPPETVGALMLQAHAAFGELRYRDAEALARRALALAPETAAARDLALRCAWISTGAPRRARDVAARLRGVTCDRRRATYLGEVTRLLERGEVLLLAGRPSRAMEQAERAHESVRWFPYSLGAEANLARRTRRLLEMAWPAPDTAPPREAR